MSPAIEAVTFERKGRAMSRRRMTNPSVAWMAAALLAAAAAGQASGQEPSAAAPAAAAAQGGIALNFKDASLDVVLEHLSETAGFVVVKDAAVDGRVSIVSRQPLTADEAVELLNTVLKDKGYTALRTGRTLKIVALGDAKKANVPVQAGTDPALLQPSDRLVTQVMPLRMVDAVKLKADLAPLVPAYADLSANASSNSLIMTDTVTNVRRVMEIVKALDSHMQGVTEVKVFPLKYASATSAAKLVNEVFKEDTSTSQQSVSPFGAFGRFRMPGMPGGPGGDSGASGDTSRAAKVKASADDRSNTVVVSGPSEVLKVVESVMQNLDSNPQSEKAVMEYRLKNSKAATLKTVLNDLFTDRSSTRTGTTGTTSTARTRGTQGGQTGPMWGPAQAAVSDTSALAALDMAGQVYVAADSDSNTLLVMAPSKFFKRIREIIAELDRSVPQVLIKVLLAEVTHTDKTDLGAEFSVLNLRASGNGDKLFTDFGVAAEKDGMQLKLLESNVTATLRALQKVGQLNVLSRPYILASDNQQAKITVGKEVPFVTQNRTTDTSQTITSYEYKDIGIILTVTAHINPDGLVILDVAPEVSELTGETVTISETLTLPVYATRTASSRVGIRDGQTIVIGGLMEDKKTDTISKVPLLGDIPWIGALFRRTIKDISKTELLIFLTPHVALEPETLKSMSKDEMEGSKIPQSLDPGAFDEHMKGMRRGAAKPEDAESEKKP